MITSTVWSWKQLQKGIKSKRNWKIFGVVYGFMVYVCESIFYPSNFYILNGYWHVYKWLVGVRESTTNPLHTATLVDHSVLPVLVAIKTDCGLRFLTQGKQVVLL